MKAPTHSSKHPLINAYERLFDRSPEGDRVYLTKEGLARTFLAKALETHPDRAKDSGRSRVELTAEFRELETAFKLLTEVLGDQRSMLLMPFTTDLTAEKLERLPTPEFGRRRAPRGWQARPTPKLLENDVADLASMKETAIRQRLVRKSNQVKANELHAASEEKSGDDPRPERVSPRKDKRFMLGRFLLKSGRITLRQLVDAVLWQRSQRPRVGEIAVEWGIMSRAEVFFVLREKNVEEMFCDVAVRLGFLTPFQRLAILARQRRLQAPIGRYFIEQGILQEVDVEEAARESQRLAREADAEVVPDAASDIPPASRT